MNPDSNSACQPEIRELRPMPPEALTRQRYVELVAIANRACEELKKAGLRNSEYCVFGRIMESMIQLG